MKLTLCVALWSAFATLAWLPPARGAEPLFELTFENGLTPGGSVSELVVAPTGGGELETGEGKAWQLDGENFLKVALPTREVLSFKADDAFTLRLRVRLEQVGRSAALISKGFGAAYRLSTDGKGGIALSYYAQGKWRSYASSGLALPMGEWAEAAVQYHGADRIVTLLVDGKLAGRFEVEAPVQTRDAEPLYIGGTPSAGDAPPRGIIGGVDEVRIEWGLAYPGAADAAPGSTVAPAQ